MLGRVCPPFGGQSANVPIHGDKSKWRDKAATSEHLQRTGMLTCHVDDGQLGCGLLPWLAE